jgi:hypothetical protein
MKSMLYVRRMTIFVADLNREICSALPVICFSKAEIR